MHKACCASATIMSAAARLFCARRAITPSKVFSPNAVICHIVRGAARAGSRSNAAIATNSWSSALPTPKAVGRGSAPFSSAIMIRLGRCAPRKGVHWIEPRLVAEVEFAGWTSDAILRHASFQGLREDKNPQEVVYDPSSPPGEPAVTPAATPARPRPAAPDVSKPARDGSL